MKSDPTGKRKIFLIDDHSILREGLRRLLEAESDLMVCGEAESGKKAIAKIGGLHPDLVIVDISLPGINGIELIKQLKAHFPRLSMLVLSMHDETLYGERALRAGAKGYIMKQASTEDLLMAIRKVLNNEIYLSTAASSQILQLIASKAPTDSSPLRRLSDRELEIIHLIAEGLATAEIAARLGISGKTVESHRGNARQKLNLRNGAELTRFALAHWGEFKREP